MDYYGCAHHPSLEAVKACDSCGKPICKECSDVFRIEKGIHAGGRVCYDCASELVTTNMSNIDRFREQVRKERTTMFVGMGVGAVVGLIFGAGMGDFGGVILMLLLGAAVGGSLGTILRKTSEAMDVIGFFGLLAPLVLIWVSPILTIMNFVRRSSQVQQSDQIIASDSSTLREMRDYFAYTQIMEEKRDRMDLEKLASQGGALFDNSYARAVINNGEAAAQAGLRESVVTISANGEIIRSFGGSRARAS